MRSTTLRTAAIATGLVAALTLPATAAFAADDVPGPEQGQVSQEQVSQEQVSQEQVSVVRDLVKSVRLADGSTARVYQLGENHYEAEIWAGGDRLDTLRTTGAPAYGQNNGLHVVLQPDGSVTSWVESGTKQQRQNKPVRVHMPDGRIAALGESKHGPRADISMPNGNRLGTLTLKHPSALNDGWTYKIVNGGKGFKGRYKFVVIDGRHGGSSWVYSFQGQLIERYSVQK
ncbi:hypothetical protein AB0J57_13795 [Streptomyces sp. NPDC049837]|uniref:hypothetical protein n=1 Tax=Streptomyces sp. NPDC049837 TaxID=3155277 RepID=UPI003448E8B6